MSRPGGQKWYTRLLFQGQANHRNAILSQKMSTKSRYKSRFNFCAQSLPKLGCMYPPISNSFETRYLSTLPRRKVSDHEEFAWFICCDVYNRQDSLLNRSITEHYQLLLSFKRGYLLWRGTFDHGNRIDF